MTALACITLTPLTSHAELETCITLTLLTSHVELETCTCAVSMGIVHIEHMAVGES